MADYQSIYPKTPVDAIEVKTLPAIKAMSTRSGAPYFDTANDSFMKLFRYIQKNEVSMTVPVEAGVEDGDMRFFVGTNDAAKALASDGEVNVTPLPERTVASVGMRGAYTRKHFDDGVRQLRAWLAAHLEWQAAGPAYPVYWNSPFVPWFIKRSEVHLPIAPATKPAATVPPQTKTIP